MSKKNNYRLAALGAGFLLICSFSLHIAGCSSKKNSTPGKNNHAAPGLSAEATIVKTSPLNIMYKASGTLLPNEEIQVYPEVNGRITKINFKEGSEVRKNDLLVQLFDGEVKAQIQKLKVQKELLITTRKRQEELLSINGISRQEYDNTATQIAAIDADIDYSEAQLRKLQIRAPFDGNVGLRNVSEGAIVSSATAITLLQQLHPLKLDFAIPEQYKAQIKTGEKISFTTDGVRDTITGVIVAIQPGANAATRTVDIRALVNNPDRKLTPGAFAHVFIAFHNNNDAITIPSQSIIPTSRDKKVAVLKNGKAQLITVTTGVRLVETVEIINGLNVGDTVLTTGIMQVKPDMDVSISKMVD